MLTRENLKSGFLRDLLSRADPDLVLWTDEQIHRSLAETLVACPDRENLWLFGYGSLIWNPAFHYVTTRKATLQGFHRQYCLWTRIGRGTPDNPGLTLGLEPGGECDGLAFRIDPNCIEEELEIVWRREMVAGSYLPTWVDLRAEGEDFIGLTFVINPAFERYASGMSEDEIVERVALATGPLGGCHEYLYNTVDHLDELGIPDPYLRRLANRVRAFLATNTKTT